MTKTKTQIKPLVRGGMENVRVRVIKAPLINTEELKAILCQRARAIVI